MLNRKTKKRLIAYSFIAPNFIGFSIFTLGPVIFAFVLAFHSWDGNNPIAFVGFSNFIKMGSDSRFWAAFKNTIIYTVSVVPLTMAAALALALLLNTKVKGKEIFRTIAFFPYVASIVACAAVWNIIFSPGAGLANILLDFLGVENLPKWAADRKWAMFTVVLFSIWKDMGYYMVIYLAGLQGISGDLYEAASLDGANRVQKFCYLTWPQLKPTTFFIVIMLTINGFKIYDRIMLITEGGPGTETLVLVYHIYDMAFGSSQFGYASALAVILFAIVLAVTLIQFKGEKSYANN